MTDPSISFQRSKTRIILRSGIALAILCTAGWALWSGDKPAISHTPDPTATIAQRSVYGEVSCPTNHPITPGSARLTIRSKPYPDGTLIWRGTQYSQVDTTGAFHFDLTTLDFGRDAIFQLSLRIQIPGLMPVFEDRQVTYDQLPAQLQLTAEAGPGIFGRVVTPNNVPVQDARIRLGDQEVWSSDEGLFALSLDEQNRPGLVQIGHARLGAAQPFTANQQAGHHQVDVQDVGDIVINQALGPLSGRVTFADGQPIVGLKLELQLIAADEELDPRAFDQVTAKTDADGSIEFKALAHGIYRITYADPGTELGLARLLGEGWKLRKHTGSTPFAIKLPFARTDFRCVNDHQERLDSVVRVAVWEGANAKRARDIFKQGIMMPEAVLTEAVVISDDFHPGRLDGVWAKPQSFVAFFALNGPRYQPTHASTYVDAAATQIELVEAAQVRQGKFGTLKLTAVDNQGKTMSPATWRVEMARIGGIVGFSREDQWIGNGVRTERGTASLFVVPGNLKIRVEVDGQAIGHAEVTVRPGETESLSVVLGR